MLVKYFDTTYIVEKDAKTSTIWLISDEKENIKVNAPIQSSIRNELVVDTVTYPYLDVSLLESEVSFKRKTKALKGREEYPVHVLTNKFMEYIGL